MNKKVMSKSRRILIVDDEDGVRMAVQMLLSFEGHVVETATGGQDALNRFKPERFDLVITDFCMPGMTGDELAQAIKCRDSSMPIILLTAFPPREIPAGIDRVVTKPFQLETLRQALDQVCPVKD
jgi:CheY-like chemotaxis protein